MDTDERTTLERVMWAIPPVLVGWMLFGLPFVLLLSLLSGP
jgi:hypothetical protein